MQALLLLPGLAVFATVAYTIALIIKDSTRYEPNEEEL
jgi:hypothetical protein